MAWKCPSCEQVFDDGDVEPAYECPECGEIFSRSESYTGSNHQCPNDHKFSPKVAIHGCPDCHEECDEVDAETCQECNEEKFDFETCDTCGEKFCSDCIDDHTAECSKVECEACGEKFDPVELEHCKKCHGDYCSSCFEDVDAHDCENVDLEETQGPMGLDEYSVTGAGDQP